MKIVSENSGIEILIKEIIYKLFLCKKLNSRIIKIYQQIHNWLYTD